MCYPFPMAILRSNRPYIPLSPNADLTELRQWGKGMQADIADMRRARMAAYRSSGIIANTAGGRLRFAMMGLRKMLLRR